MKVKINLINKFLYVIFCISWCIGDYTNNVNDEYKYVILLAHICILLFFFIRKIMYYDNRNVSFLYELKQISFVMISFIIITLIYQVAIMEFKTYFIKEVFYMFIPCLYIFLLVNSIKEKDKDFYFTSTLVIFTFFFLIEFRDVLSVSNILKISFIKSYSPFESNIPFAGVFLVLYTYFLLQNKKKRAILSFVLCFLAFKRIHVIYILILPILYKIFKNRNKLSKKILNITKIIFILSPLLIEFLLSDYFSQLFYKIFNIEFDKFVMSRFSIVNYVLDLDFKNYGLGTTYYLKPPTQIYDMSNGVTQFNMHCDLLRIYIETSIIGLIVLVNNYFNITKDNIFKFFLMLTYFLIMFSSHAITSFYTWILIYMFLAMYDGKEKIKDGEN